MSQSLRAWIMILFCWFCIRYVQVGNAVAVPVARALGYGLSLAIQGSATHEPLFTLPQKFPNILERLASASSEDNA